MICSPHRQAHLQFAQAKITKTLPACYYFLSTINTTILNSNITFKEKEIVIIIT